MPKPTDRHPCRCECDCDCSAAGERCWLCSNDYHAPARKVRRRHAARLVLWTRVVTEMTPDSSSGISVKALRSATQRFDKEWAELVRKKRAEVRA